MVSQLRISRGTKRWAKRPGGLEDWADEVVDAVNTLINEGVAAGAIFSVNEASYNDNHTLTGTDTLQIIEMTASGKAVTLADINATFYSGGVITFFNKGATNAFAIKNNSGTTIVSSLAPGREVRLFVKSAATANGTFQIETPIRSLSDDPAPELSADIDLNGNTIIDSSGTVTIDDNANVTGDLSIDGDVTIGGGDIDATDIGLTTTGKLRSRPVIVNVTGATKILALSDACTIQNCNRSSAIAITVPTDAAVTYPDDTYIVFDQINTGAQTITGDTGVSINGVSGGSKTSLGRGVPMVLRRIGADNWSLSG